MTAVAMIVWIAALGSSGAHARDEARELLWGDLVPPREAAAAGNARGGKSAGSLKLSKLLAPASAAGAVAALDGELVRLPGFIVPLESDEVGLLAEFFLVPYYGACIHVPPPPPNQIVYVKLRNPFEFESMMEPFWVEGIIHTEDHAHELATAVYTLDARKVEKYEYE